DEQQEAHQIRALLVAGRANLLGQVVADEPEVDVVDELVAHEGAHDLGHEFLEPQSLALGRDELTAILSVALEAWHAHFRKVAEAGKELVDAHGHRAVDDARMATEKFFDLGGGL